MRRRKPRGGGSFQGTDKLHAVSDFGWEADRPVRGGARCFRTLNQSEPFSWRSAGE